MLKQNTIGIWPAKRLTGARAPRHPDQEPAERSPCPHPRAPGGAGPEQPAVTPPEPPAPRYRAPTRRAAAPEAEPHRGARGPAGTKVAPACFRRGARAGEGRRSRARRRFLPRPSSRRQLGPRRAAASGRVPLPAWGSGASAPRRRYARQRAAGTGAGAAPPPHGPAAARRTGPDTAARPEAAR